MAKGYDIHQARMMALQSIGKDLARRAKSKCELCSAAGVPLQAYEVPPAPAETPDIDRTLLLCADCLAALERPNKISGQQWRWLSEVVWSEQPAVQVAAWRLLTALSSHEDWAREALEFLELDPETEAWARDT